MKEKEVAFHETPCISAARRTGKVNPKSLGS